MLFRVPFGAHRGQRDVGWGVHQTEERDNVYSGLAHTPLGPVQIARGSRRHSLGQFQEAGEEAGSTHWSPNSVPDGVM